MRRDDDITQCNFCRLVLKKSTARQITSPIGEVCYWCGKCTRARTISEDVVNLFRCEGAHFCSLLWDETYVLERTSEITDHVSARLYCERHKCAYAIFYENAWRRKDILDFFQARIGTNTKYVRGVANSIIFGTDEEDTSMKKLWEHLSSKKKEMEEKITLTRLYQPRNAYLVKNHDMELLTANVLPDGAKEEIVLLVAVNFDLMRPFMPYTDFLIFELVGNDETKEEDEEFYVRVCDRETREMIGFLFCEERFTLSQGAYREWMEQVGYIYTSSL